MENAIFDNLLIESNDEGDWMIGLREAAQSIFLLYLDCKISDSSKVLSQQNFDCMHYLLNPRKNKTSHYIIYLTKKKFTKLFSLSYKDFYKDAR